MDVERGWGRQIVVAIGGNALAGDGADGASPKVLASRVATGVADLVSAGWRVVVTHGNGPQVGEILLRSELTLDSPLVSPLSLESSVAQTEGDLGHLLETALLSELAKRHMRDRVGCILSHVVVNRTDVGFGSPTKPVGRTYDPDTADRLSRKYGWAMVQGAGGGFRRVVASPRPLRIVETEQIRALSVSGSVVVAAGGGGIAVFEIAPGSYEGAEAVVDKDRASAVLAASLRAPFLVMSTGVERVALNYGCPDQRDLDRLNVAEARGYLERGEFPPGSMGPKIEAAIDFISGGGTAAIVTSLTGIGTVLQRAGGTWVVP